jgi:hypothetical protein
VKLKLDEDLTASAAPRLAALGHDVQTVLDESLGGKHDMRLAFRGVVWRSGRHALLARAEIVVVRCPVREHRPGACRRFVE